MFTYSRLPSPGSPSSFRCCRFVLLGFTLALALNACTITPAPAPEPSLYEELGGEAGVDRLATDFIREIAADERIKGRYRNSDIGRFHRMMKEQMCMETGGGCAYTGDDMRRTHAGMNISRVEFNGIVEALMRAMESNDIAQSTQNRLLAIYAPMHDDIVGR